MARYRIALQVLFLTSVYQLAKAFWYEKLPNFGREDMVEKEVGAVIRMTLEFLRDMDMKMRDVKRIERKYLATFDFGSGKIFAGIETIFEHMVTIYKNMSRISKIMVADTVDLRSDITGSLQFMLSDYCNLLGLVDMYRERFMFYKRYGYGRKVREKVKQKLIQLKVYPYFYDPDQLQEYVTVTTSNSSLDNVTTEADYFSDPTTLERK